MEKTDMMPFVDQRVSIVDGIKDVGSLIFSSFESDDPKSKVTLYNALSSGDSTIKDNINKTIVVRDVVVMPVEIVPTDDVGNPISREETSVVPRTTLIDIDGKCYSASSWGVYNSVQKLKGVFGTLHFDEGLKLVPVEVKTKRGYTLNLKLV